MRTPVVVLSALLVVAAGAATCESSNGLLECTLRVEAAVVHLGFQNISFRTRTYNGQFPGPLMRARPGDRVRILLQNRLEKNGAHDGCHAALDHFRAPNATNLHIHGIFDSSADDNTFVCVSPGQDYLYSYTIPVGSGTSTLWYHPHLEGSSSMQLYGGMAGVFEVVDPSQDALFHFATTKVLLLQSLVFDPNSKDFIEVAINNPGNILPLDLHNPHEFNGRLILANGEVSPSMALGIGQHARLKLVNALSGSISSLNLGFVDEAAEVCRLHVLAYDGVYLLSPRLQRTVLLPSGGRADIAISCSKLGQYVFGTLLDGVEGYGGVVTHELKVLEVDIEATRMGEGVVPLPKELPGLPPHLRNLLNEKVDMHNVIRMSDLIGSNVVDGVPYMGKGAVSYTMPRGSIQEWSIEGGEGFGVSRMHSYHQHFTPYQIVNLTLTNDLVGRIGDYRDTVMLYHDLNFTIRFVAPFEGRMMIHCHILKHEDLGMMTVARVVAVPSMDSLLELSPPGVARRTLAVVLCLVVALVFGLLTMRWQSYAASLCNCYERCPEGPEDVSDVSRTHIGKAHSVV